MKFFAKPNNLTICSVCKKDITGNVFKTVKQGRLKFEYCESCYNEYYGKVRERVMEQVRDRMKKGQKIGLNDAVELTKSIVQEQSINSK